MMRSQRNFSRVPTQVRRFHLNGSRAQGRIKLNSQISLRHNYLDRKDGDDKPMVRGRVKESRVVAPENARKEVSGSTPVETDDRYWIPIRAFTNGYINNRAAEVELDPNLEWTLLSYKTYRSIESEVPLRQAEESLDTKTGDSLGVVGKESIVLQLAQFHRRSMVVDGLDIDLLLGLVWYERYEDFVFDMKNDVLKTGLKRSSPIQARFRCSGRPRLRV